ncbi:MAG: tetratricopeptide repeat protein, partial [Aggregatilineales bacterium]
MAESDQGSVRVFLSYARADDDTNYDDPAKSLLRRLHNDMKAAGFEVWWDRMSLPSRGETFTSELEAAIRSCQRFVLVVGPGIVSEYVRREWEFALSQCLPITPMLRAGDYSLIPDALRAINALDFRAPRSYSNALADLVSRLRENTLPLARLFNVPPLPPGFITREKPFETAKDAIRADAINPVVVSTPPHATALYGYGGIGKSTLAAVLAADCDVRRRFKDGVIWLNIGQNPLIASRQADLGDLFGDDRTHYQDEKSGSLRLSWLLADKQALIILDDVWDHQIVRQFPVSGSASRILLTTRSPQIAREVGGTEVQLDVFTPQEGAKLIAVRTKGSLDDATYYQISRILGGHTLAISLAARLIAESYATDAADLLNLLQKRKDGDSPFKDLKVRDEDKNLNLELSLSLSYEALTEDLKRRFRALGSLAIDSIFDLKLTAAVWADGETDDARKPLSDLIRAGLIESAGDGHFSQHRLLRAYAHALLLRGKEYLDIFARYADSITVQAAQFDQLPLEAWGAFEATLAPHLLVVGDRLAADFQHGNPPDAALTDRALKFAYSVMTYLGNRREVRRELWLDMGLAAAEVKEDPARQALFLNTLGIVWSARGEKRKALGFLEQALPLYQTMEDRRGEAACLNNLGLVWFDLGENRKALDFYQQARSLLHAMHDHGGEAKTLTNIGRLLSDLGENRKALDFYQQALSLLQSMGDRNGEAATLTNIGVGWSDLGEKHKALGVFEQALPLYRAMGDRNGEAATLTNIGVGWSDLGEKHKALGVFEQALPLYREVGDRSGEATALGNIGLVWFDLGEKRKALDYYNQALPLYRAVENRRSEATALNNIGRLWSELGEKRRALDFFAQALPLRKAVEDRGGEAATLHNIGLAWSELGERRKALDFFEYALSLYRVIEDRRGEATTLSSIGGILSALGDRRKALDFHNQALPLHREVGNHSGEAITLNDIGMTWLALGEKRQALEFFEQALPLYRALEDRHGEATTLNNIGGVWSELGEKHKALDFYNQALPLYRAVEDRDGEATASNNIGGVWFELGEKRKALDFYNQALPLYRAVENRRGEGYACANIGTCFEGLGDLEKAIAYMERSAILFKAIEDVYAGAAADRLERLKRKRDGVRDPEHTDPSKRPVTLNAVKEKEEMMSEETLPSDEELLSALRTADDEDTIGFLVGVFPNAVLDALEKAVERYIAASADNEATLFRSRLDLLRRLRPNKTGLEWEVLFHPFAEAFNKRQLAAFVANLNETGYRKLVAVLQAKIADGQQPEALHAALEALNQMWTEKLRSEAILDFLRTNDETVARAMLADKAALLLTDQAWKDMQGLGS